ncbi:MAG: hypothetical protein QOI66_4350 [Myxococcales bacterium]|jgi:hypothetical protein|nr:hypothetical protein [Myxococcales bacterium]
MGTPCLDFRRRGDSISLTLVAMKLNRKLNRMTRAAVVFILGLTVAAATPGCGPKNKYCPENMGPCYPPDNTPKDAASDSDGTQDGAGDGGAPADGGADTRP